VNGTAVYNTAGENLGSVYDVVFDKASGKLRDPQLREILEIGELYHPLPLNQLTYDPEESVYVVNLVRSRLEGAPTYEADDLSLWDERRSTHIDTSYGTGPAQGLGDARLGIRGAVR
jgi:hypothetical protein